MTDSEFRAAKPKPAPDPNRPPYGPDPEEPVAAVRKNLPESRRIPAPEIDPLVIMREITYRLRPLDRERRRMVLETLLEISE